jgi:hypothetical protein
MQRESIVFDAFNEFIVVVRNMRAGSAAYHQVARRTFTSRPLAEELMAEASRFAASAYAWDLYFHTYIHTFLPLLFFVFDKVVRLQWE